MQYDSFNSSGIICQIRQNIDKSFTSLSCKITFTVAKFGVLLDQISALAPIQAEILIFTWSDLHVSLAKAGLKVFVSRLRV